MKKFSLLTLVLLLSSHPVAGDALYDMREKQCHGIEEIAFTVMEMRQDEAPVHEVIKEVGFSDVIAEIVIEAYKNHDVVSNSEMRLMVSPAFANSYKTKCQAGAFDFRDFTKL